MRQKQGAKYAVCRCGALPWPHRKGYCTSGAGLAYMHRTCYGPSPEEGPGLAKNAPPADGEDPFAFFEALASVAQKR
jgi:hypothetical protein